MEPATKRALEALEKFNPTTDSLRSIFIDYGYTTELDKAFRTPKYARFYLELFRKWVEYRAEQGQYRRVYDLLYRFLQFQPQLLKKLEPELKKLISRNKEEKKTATIWWLEYLHDDQCSKEIVSILVQQINSKNVEERKKIADFLDKQARAVINGDTDLWLAHPEITDALMTAIPKEKDKLTKELLVRALTWVVNRYMLDFRTLPTFLELLKDSEARNRLSALLALEVLVYTDEHIPWETDILPLLNDKDKMVRKEVGRLLTCAVNIGAILVEETGYPLAEKNKLPLTERKHFRSKEELRNFTPRSTPRLQKFIQPLVKMLGDKVWQVADQAAHALVYIGGMVAIKELERYYDTTEWLAARDLIAEDLYLLTGNKKYQENKTGYIRTGKVSKK